MVKHGSTFLVIILIMSGLLLMYAITWRGMVLSWDILYTHYERNRRSTILRGLARYSIALYKHNKVAFNRLLTERESWIESITWPPEQQQERGVISLQKIGAGIQLVIWLENVQHQRSLSARAYLEPKGEKFLLSNYTVEG